MGGGGCGGGGVRWLQKMKKNKGRHFPSRTYNLRIARMKTKRYPLATSKKEMRTSVLHPGKYVSFRSTYFNVGNRILIGFEYDGALSENELVDGIRCKKTKKLEVTTWAMRRLSGGRANTGYSILRSTPRRSLLFIINGFAFILHNIAKTRS